MLETYNQLTLFQQSSYKLNKYVKTFKRYYIYSIPSFFRLMVLLLGLLSLIIDSLEINFALLIMIFGNLLMLEPKLIKLKFTKRILRLLIVYFGLSITILFFYSRLVYVQLYMVPFTIIICNTINKPIENTIKIYYKNKSKKIIENSNCLKIGITGSFGKTSTKYFLAQILQNNYLVHASPKSYNTLMGLCKDIRENINCSTEIYILEMGATKRYDILKINNMVNVDIGIITSIGTQHLESFKNIDNILKTKLEILESNSIKTLFINSDIDVLNNYEYPTNIEVIRIGTNELADYKISDVEENFNNLEFKLNNKKICANILGKHNIYNLAICYAVSKHLNIKENIILDVIKNIEIMDHRLKLLKYDNFQIIDDSFNSNFQGFLNALDTISLSNTYNILITPGIVEQDTLLDKYYPLIANKIKNSINEVYLIKNKTIGVLEKSLKDVNYLNFIVVDSFKEAYNLIQSKKYKTKYTILIENDLTDYYLSRG